MNNDEKWDYIDKMYLSSKEEVIKRAEYFKDLNDGVVQGPKVDDEYNDELWKETLGNELFLKFLNQGKVEAEVLDTGYRGPHFADKDFYVYYDCIQYELLKIKDVFGTDISFKQEFNIGTAKDSNGEPPEEKPVSVEPHYELNIKNSLMFYMICDQLENGASVDSISALVEGKDISVENSSKKTK